VGTLLLGSLFLIVIAVAGVVVFIGGVRKAISKDRKLEALEDTREDITRETLETASVLVDQYYNGYDHSQIPRLVAALDLQVKEYYRNSRAIDAHKVDRVERKALD
jgi:hypothetical protein